MSATKALTKSFMATLPAQLSTEFKISEEEATTFLQTYFTTVLGSPSKGARTKTPGVKGTNGKGRLTGYLLFSNENRSRVRDENGGMNPKDASRELGKLWKELSPQEQSSWVSRADAANSANGIGKSSTSHSSTAVEVSTPVVEASTHKTVKKIVKKVVAKK